MSKPLRRFTVLAALTVSAALASATPASAITIGTLDPSPAGSGSCGDNLDWVQVGTDYVVPSGLSIITSWSTNSNAAVTQYLTFKVFRPLGLGVYAVVAHDARKLATSTTNKFPVSLAVQPGDVIGLHTPFGAGSPDCKYNSNENIYYQHGDVQDGASATFLPDTNFRINVTADVVANTFTYTVKGKVVELNVLAAGTGSVSDASSPASATAAKKKKKKLFLRPSSANGGPGTLEIPLNLTKLAKKKLKRKGKLKLGARITFTPTGGLASSQTATLKLKSKKKK